MKIVRIEHVHAAATWRIFDSLNVMTDDGFIGWREFTAALGKNAICRLAGAAESWETVTRWLAHPQEEILPERSVQAIRYAYRALHLFEHHATRAEGIRW